VIVSGIGCIASHRAAASRRVVASRRAIASRRAGAAVVAALGLGAWALVPGVGGAFGAGTESGTGTGAGGQAGAGAVAHAARTVTLNESGNLRETSHHGTHLNFQGTTSGTIRGSIYIHLDVSSQSRVSAEVSIYPSNGSLTGTSTASYHAVGGQATFSGTLSISRGTGTYAHAHAPDLSFSGTIQRVNDDTTVHLSGPLSY
jgi:hypothetical protein